MASFKQWLHLNEFVPNSVGVDTQPTDTASAANKVVSNWMSQSGNSDNVANIMQSKGRPSTLAPMITKNAADAMKSAQPSLANKITPADIGRRMSSELFPNKNTAPKIFMKRKMKKGMKAK